MIAVLSYKQMLLVPYSIFWKGDLLRNDLHHLCIYIYYSPGYDCKLQPVRVNIISFIIILLIISVDNHSLPVISFIIIIALGSIDYSLIAYLF